MAAEADAQSGKTLSMSALVSRPFRLEQVPKIPRMHAGRFQQFVN